MGSQFIILALGCIGLAYFLLKRRGVDIFSKFHRVRYRLQSRLLNILGDIKVFRWPMFVVYDPKSYRLRGQDFSKIQSCIKKYDVVLRRYDNYLDTYLIPGFWNHAGIYMGHRGDTNGTVVHALAEGVVEETLFDFCKADHLIILRPKFPFSKSDVSERTYSTVGKAYDFDFDFHCEDRLSCTELIAHIYSGCHHQIKQTYTLGRASILPDSIAAANFNNILEIRK